MLVIGPAEAGKTTFTAWLANHLRARGLTVGVVDADVGQSEVGPPATIGLGAVRGPLTRSGDADPVAIEFVGVTSPGRRPWQVADATGRVVASARQRFDRVIVDTSGFVAGGFGAAVKGRKIGASDPDVVVAIQGKGECEHILRSLTGARPRVIRLPAVRGARPRTAAARKRHREVALARYLDGARTITLDATRVAVRSVTGAPMTLDAVAAGTLVGLRGTDGTTVALGAIESVDHAQRTFAVRTTATDVSAIAAVTIGETTVEG